MFKKLSILAALGLVAASCNVKEERVLCSAPVSVHVNDFLVTVDTFSDTLDRIIAKLQVVSTDGRMADATNVRMTLSAGGKAFNPTTGLATSNTGFSNTVNISAAAGTTSSSITYLFLASDEQTLDVTVDVLDAEGQVLSHRVATGVPFKRNRTTKLSGALYSAEAQANSFQLETAWLPTHEVNF